MKERRDLVRGWLRKAESDLIALDAAAEAGALDAASFHAQQAVEKSLKAYLISAQVEFPFTHNLSKLVELCATAHAGFASLLDVVEPLTPYAVQLRYDAEFWPDEPEVADAKAAAIAVRDYVLAQLNTQNS